MADSNSSGFGTFAPANKEGEKNDVEEEDEDEETDGEFITLQELRRNRLKEEGKLVKKLGGNPNRVTAALGLAIVSKIFLKL